MGNPVTVSKALSETISSQDEKGILAASWTSNHYNGVSPLRWVGSVGILKEFMNTKRPVKFAQCFVFAGVFTTKSLRDRIANLREIRNKYKPNYFTSQGNEDVVFEGFMDADFIMIGSNFDVSGLLKNTSHRSRTVEGKLVCETVTYMGKRVNVIKSQGFRALIKPKQGNILIIVSNVSLLYTLNRFRLICKNTF
ncbi:hypothetical protein KUTeg_022662 [Tegillarca granosa]|uniref:Uncharacterized protein n=1 Tax=Tegillarca granosa TaxID=220873 RepID=A0ABQ9E4W6_TEGGR|nr:hypothetical protein KUTeg_022662 [Tegillarca granosa]